MGKITEDMTVKDSLVAMSEGNPGAYTVLMNIMSRRDGLLDIIRLDDMGIHGWKIWTLSKDCCGHNLTRITRTISLLFYGSIPDEQIHANLDRGKGIGAIPFIDDSVKIKGVPPYGRKFDLSHPKWAEWAAAQSESFKRRMEEA